MVAYVEEKRGLKREMKTEGNEVGYQKKRKMKTGNVRNWLNLLPKVPSHYCRASSRTCIKYF